MIVNENQSGRATSACIVEDERRIGGISIRCTTMIAAKNAFITPTASFESLLSVESNELSNSGIVECRLA